MEEDLWTGFSLGVSSQSSPQMTDTTSGSHAPPMVIVKTRRLVVGKQSAVREANWPHQGKPRCAVAQAVKPRPAVKPCPETHDLSSGEDEGQSVRSSVAGRTLSVASSTAELLATRALLKQKRVAADTAAAAEVAKAAAEAAKVEELEMEVLITAAGALQLHTSESAAAKNGRERKPRPCNLASAAASL